jgi:hypothetical protein
MVIYILYIFFSKSKKGIGIWTFLNVSKMSSNKVGRKRKYFSQKSVFMTDTITKIFLY